MKKLLLAALAFALLPFPSRAQDTPKADVAAGYSFLWIGQGFTFFMNGGSGSVALNVNNWLGAVGDFGAYHASPGVSLTAETYTFGPRFSYRKWGRLVPFAQVLVGGLHASAVTTGFTNASNAFAFGAGAGPTLGSTAGEDSRCGRNWNTSASARMEIRQAPFAFRPALCSASEKGTDRTEFLVCWTRSISGTAKKNGNITLLESLTASPDGRTLTLS
jgi:hypothetical protein